VGWMEAISRHVSGFRKKAAIRKGAWKSLEWEELCKI
jgi:hypothetical protein